jgi:hypothetical protein
MHPAGPDYLLNGNHADFGLQSAPMQSGNWQQNQQHPNPNGNGASRTYANSPPDLSFSRSSHNASGTELVASPTQTYYNVNSNGLAPVGTATSSRDPTLGGLNSTTKAQSQRQEVTVSQQSFLNVDENGAGPSGTVDDSCDHDHDHESLYDWANDRCTYTLEDPSPSHAGPSTFNGAYDESLE